MIMKKKMTGATLILLIIAVLIILILHSRYIKKYDVRDYSTGSDTYYELVYSEDKQNYFHLTEEQFSQHGPSVFNSKYIAYPVLRSRICRKGYTERLNDVKRFDVIIYNMNTQEKVHTIDVKEYLQAYSNEWQLFDPRIESIYSDGRYYARFYLEKKPQKISKDETKNIFDRSMSMLYIDIENGESFWESDGSITRKGTRESSKTWLEYAKLLKINGCEETDIHYFPSQNELVQISLPTKSLPAENKKLYELFPSLKEVDRNSGLYVRIYLNNWEDDLGLIELLLPEGQEEKFQDAFENAGHLTNMKKEDYDELADAYIAYQRNEQKEESR